MIYTEEVKSAARRFSFLSNRHFILEDEILLRRAGAYKSQQEWLDEFGLKRWQVVHEVYVLENVNEAGWCTFRCRGYRAPLAPQEQWMHISCITKISTH